MFVMTFTCILFIEVSRMNRYKYSMGECKMFKKLTILILISMLGLVIAACGNKKDTNNADEEKKLVPIEVKLDVPEHGEKGKAVSFSAKVKQGDENVDDASEVKYEVWENGHKEESEMIEAKHDKNGVYNAEKTFDEDGVYTVQVHVTARDMHTMPKAEIQIGEATANHDEGEDHDDHDHEGSVSIHLMKPDTIKANEEAKMMVQVENEEQPLKDAKVRFEIYKEGQEKHEYVELDSSKAGEYEVSYAFPESGTYNVQVHVTKGEELHTHKMETVEVQ